MNVKAYQDLSLIARCSYLGPFQEITTAIHVPIDASSGLDKVHFTWAGTFVLEALVYLFPDKHIILIDTDCVPTSLFEVEELVRMTQTHLDQAAGVEPNFFFLRLPNGQYGPVSQLSRSEKCCTGPFNWGGAHCAGEKVKRKVGQFQRKSL